MASHTRLEYTPAVQPAGAPPRATAPVLRSGAGAASLVALELLPVGLRGLLPHRLLPLSTALPPALAALFLVLRPAALLLGLGLLVAPGFDQIFAKHLPVLPRFPDFLLRQAGVHVHQLVLLEFYGVHLLLLLILLVLRPTLGLGQLLLRHRGNRVTVLRLTVRAQCLDLFFQRLLLPPPLPGGFIVAVDQVVLEGSVALRQRFLVLKLLSRRHNPLLQRPGLDVVLELQPVGGGSKLDLRQPLLALSPLQAKHLLDVRVPLFNLLAPVLHGGLGDLPPKHL
mmetsp:Transcript_86503/g.231852  ORF Transcript_86503/g.231852 Transcript_86503/m.231852 type:complete len:282 (+) Transcript_86503:81-926(+)